MWRQRRKWEGPSHPWQKQRLIIEKRLMKEYGLKNKRELWIAETIARKWRAYARYLNAKQAAGQDISEEKERFLTKLKKLGVLSENAELDDVLDLTVKDVLERRLQTMLVRKGLAKTMKQARQFIVHGHIMVNGEVVDAPSYLVKKEEEDKIEFVPFSPLANPEHPARKLEQKEETNEESA
ncbi:NEQ247 [Nanoarchaeum equitans Kin4-M]|uniref:Small ribosomal subunit protein uS4 n=1 Tax=Nanoarchaeum equitans (strain Kin4-M) TaxID=228908 RepID=RS4_NANEQ|nr:RecName: Full=Small ribosomal subunit protein uS4; AltName: Full=30S ribosomal protein S4 [Nanoarchaeum equitans Kin4-M]AAR39100.1 NEQ247 [Nanoarchaeum equitans Kin4-M]